MKKLKWAALIVAVIVVVAVLVVFFNLNGIIRSTVESQGTASLKVPTTLQGANLSLFGGKIGLKDLEIGSPQGFSAPKILSLGGLDVKVNYGDLRQDPIKIESITIEKPKLVIEQAGGKLNFKALADNLPATPESQPTGQTGESKPMRLIISQLVLNNAEVVIRPGIPGVADQEITIPIPSMTLQDVGSGGGEKKDGVPLKDVVMETITKMVSKAADSDKLPEPVRLLLKGDVNAIAGQLKDKAVEGLTKSLEGATKGGGGAGKAVSEGLEGLLGKKKPATKP